MGIIIMLTLQNWLRIKWGNSLLSFLAYSADDGDDNADHKNTK